MFVHLSPKSTKETLLINGLTILKAKDSSSQLTFDIISLDSTISTTEKGVQLCCVPKIIVLRKRSKLRKNFAGQRENVQTSKQTES